jgi:hypothetical protein
MRKFGRAGVTGLLLIGVCLGQPQVRGHFGVVPEKFREYQVILEPDQDAPEWWADAQDPTRFEPASAQPVIQPQPKSGPRNVTPDGYKDPFILHAEGAYHCFVIGVLRTERVL